MSARGKGAGEAAEGKSVKRGCDTRVQRRAQWAADERAADETVQRAVLRQKAPSSGRRRRLVVEGRGEGGMAQACEGKVV
eukprot:1851571-Pleurochrysis_carterae.AAC.1